jgi:hypothetical protein
MSFFLILVDLIILLILPESTIEDAFHYVLFYVRFLLKILGLNIIFSTSLSDTLILYSSSIKTSAYLVYYVHFVNVPLTVLSVPVVIHHI